MSYDLRIFSTREVARDELTDLLAHGGLAASPADSDGSREISRGTRHRYSFTLGGADTLEPEDVPPEVVAVALDIGFLYEVTVEGTVASEIPHAVRFARRLAHATSGAVEDPQTGEIWSRGTSRSIERDPAGRVNVVGLRWYARASSSHESGQIWLECARRWLPEALPHRFGQFEPLTGRLERDGDSAFLDAVRDSPSLVIFAGAPPCVFGYSGDSRGQRDVVSFGMSVFAGAMDDPRWRSAVQRFFIGYAERIDAIAATAELVREWEWSGRSLRHGLDTEFTVHLAPSGQWRGLPPYPVSWLWLGDAYLDLIGPEPAIGSSVASTRGRLTELSAIPTGRELLPGPWLPEVYLAKDVTDREPGGRQSYRLAPADVMPADLRH